MTPTTAEATPSVERQTYSPIEAAEILGISYRHFMDLVAEGQIPGTLRFGRRVVILREAIDGMLAEARRSIEAN